MPKAQSTDPVSIFLTHYTVNSWYCLLFVSRLDLKDKVSGPRRDTVNYSYVRDTVNYSYVRFDKQLGQIGNKWDTRGTKNVLKTDVKKSLMYPV